VVSNSLEIGYVVAEEIVDSWLHLDITWVHSPRRESGASWAMALPKTEAQRCRVDEVVFISPDKIVSAIAKANYRGNNVKNR
jgi:hypothetical protein